jgi:ribosomal protein L40E
MSVQYCGSCGKPLIPGQLFCQHCGARNDENATRVEPVPQAPSRTPGGTMYCGQCGFLLTAQDRACRRCGTPVDFPNALIADESISDAPTIGVSTPDAQATFQAHGTAMPAAGYPPQPSVSQPSSAPYSPPPPSVPYDASTFSTVAPYGQPPGAARGAPGYQAGPPPNYPPPRKKQPWPLIVSLVIVGLLLIVGGGVVLALRSGNGTQTGNNPTATPAPDKTSTTAITPSPTIPPSPTPVGLTPDTASALIQEFYADINARDFDAAYDLLSSAYQQRQSRQNFKNGFVTTVQDTLTIEGAQTLSDGTVQVNVTLVAVDNKNGSQVTTVYTGYYIVILENGALRITKGKLTKQG